MEAQDTNTRGQRQVVVGRVVSDKMDKTVTIAVEKIVTHSLYQRQMKRTTKFHAHDEKNECRVGDTVAIVSCRPLSKSKRWRVSEIVARAV